MTKQKVQAGRNWYAVHTYAGYEDAVVRNLKQRIESLGMEDKIFSAVVPTEKKIKIVGGKRKTIEEKIYPGYVLVDMIVTDNSWYVVRNRKSTRLNSSHSSISYAVFCLKKKKK